MLESCIPLDQLPGQSRLLKDYACCFERLRRFYDYSPWEEASYELAARAIAFPSQRRRQLVEELARQNPGHPALEKLLRPDSYVVVTGQQVGLFGGPAYTAYKALTAIRLARRLEERGLVAVPVFWMATEDHDLAEVDHCWVFDREQQSQKLECAVQGGGGPVGLLPAERIPLEELARALEGFTWGGEVLGVVAEAYKNGATLGDGFRALLGRLFSDRGMLFFDPLAPGARRLAAPLLEDALADIGRLVELVLERNRELEAAGYHTQVRVESDSTLMFVLDGGRRLPLKRWTQAPPPERLSPNALLRPVVQDYLMPTVAVVMGPAEAAYMAQAAVLYRELLGRMPVVALRASFTLADERTARLLERYGLGLPDLLKGQEFVREAIGSRLTPPELGRRLDETAEAVSRQLDVLRGTMEEFDGSLVEALDRSRRKIQYQIEKIRRKAGREALRRSERASREADGLCRLLAPQRQLQERFYSILPFLAAGGLGLLDRLEAAIDPSQPGHCLFVY